MSRSPRLNQLAIVAMSGTLLLAGASEGSAEEGGEWKAGVARAVITPQEPMWMAGYGSRDRPAEGTLHELWAKALVLENGAGRRAVLVTTDLLGLPKNISDRVCARLKDELGLQRSDVMLTSSHTHCGPVLREALYDIYPLDDTEREKVERYSQHLEEVLVGIGVQAAEQMEPVQVGVGQGVTRFAVNRRNNREADILKLAELAGPVDHSVPVLSVRDDDGRLKAVAFGYACHNTVLSFYQWCGDYAGFAQLELEAAHPGATAMFFSGCGADQNPLPRRSVALAQQYGRELAAAVDRVLEEGTTAVGAPLETRFTTIELALSPPPSREEFARLAEENTGYVARWARRLGANLDRGEPLTSAYPFPIQVWQIGEKQTIVALGGEVVVDYAVRLKRELGDPLWVVGYANDVMAYIPSLRVLNEGGYEGETSMRVYGLPSKWAPEIEERIVAEVHRMVDAVRPAGGR